MTRIVLLSFLWSIVLWGCSPPRTPPLTIATAANMQFAMKEITQAFTQKTGIACEVVVSSSGKLTAQIREGAPFDVFVSADMKYPVALFESGRTTSEPEVYAYGRLVLWSTTDGVEPSVEMLHQEKVRHIALANPQTAPYGVAAVETLKHYGIYDQTADKLVFGESISQVNQFINAGAAEVGFTAQAAVVSSETEGKGRWLAVDTTAYSPIAQGVVVIDRQGLPKDEAQRFYAFLFSQEGRKVLTNFGYTTN